ncbi:MAG: LruC domain-containing protein [Bacteroidales bacterium]
MKKIFLLLTLFTITISSCIKAPDSQPVVPDPEIGTIVPSTFDWKTTKEIKVTISVTAVDAQSKEKLHIIKIYNSPLLNSGSLISSGAATPNKPLTASLSVASIIDKLYIYEINPNGIAKVTEQEVLSPLLNVKLQNEHNLMLTRSNAFITGNVMNPAPTVPFPATYDVTINNNSSITLTGFNSGESSSHGNTYKSYYIPQGFRRTEEINFGNWLAHSVLYVKGTLTIDDNVQLNKSSIVILDGGTVNIEKLSNGGGYTWPIPSIYIQNGGKLNISEEMQANSGTTIVNKGVLSCKEKIDVNSGSSVYNENIIRVLDDDDDDDDDDDNLGNGIMLLSNSSALYNSGSITISKINVSNNATVNNDVAGNITVKNWYQTNGTILNNHGELVATKEFKNSGGGTVNNFCRITTNKTSSQRLTANLKTGSLWHSQKFYGNDATFNMDGGSMFLMAKMESNPYKISFISTSPTFSLVKNSGNMPDLRWAASQVKGNIEFVHEKLVEGSGKNGRDLYSSSFTNGALLTKEQTINIPGTTCNQSLGQIEPGTGVPTEPDPEFITYFPSQTGWGTYAFEDLWPIKGDYDLNDMVLKFRLAFTSNSSNKVTQITFDYIIAAVGAEKNSGVAFQLDNVLASNVQSVTGQILGSGTPFSVTSNGTETGVNLAIIPVFNSAKDVVDYPGFLNTDKSNSHIISPTNQIVVTFSDPVDQSQLTMESFNLFISVDERGREIHLPTYVPTSKFNSSLTVGRGLNPDDVFKHNDGMMWGLMFPNSFDYPIERASVIKAYPYFATWAISGGTNYPDWYSNKTGYRNPELIY